MCDYLKDEYSTLTVTEGIQRLFNEDIFAYVGDYIFNYKECLDSEEWHEKVKEQVLYLGLEEQPLKFHSAPLLQMTFKQWWAYDASKSMKSEIVLS